MKILIVTDKPPWPGTSGGALAVMSAIKGLLEHKVDLTVVYTVTGKHPDNRLRNPEESTIEAQVIPVKINTTINLFNLFLNLLFSRLPYNVKRFKKKQFSKQLNSIFKREKFDIVQIEGINMSAYIDYIRKNSNSIIALRSHNVEHEIWERLSAGEKNIFRKYYLQVLSQRLKNYELQTINSCDCHITLTERDKVYFENAGIDIPGFTFPYARFTSVPDRSKIDSKIIGYIGSLDWKPNQEGIQWFINKVWTAVHKEHPDHRMVIAGRNAPDWLIKKFNKPGIEYLGEIDNAEAFMNNSYTLIIPLLSGSGIRVRAIQAMSMGIPVVTTAKGIEGINASHGKELLIASTAGEYIQQLSGIIMDEKLYNSISGNARAFIKKYYDNKKLCGEMVEFYSKISQ